MVTEDENKENINPGEPESFYNLPANNSIRFYSSFHEQEEEMTRYWAGVTPIQRLQHLHEMIIRSFGLTQKDLNNPILSSKITFRQR